MRWVIGGPAIVSPTFCDRCPLEECERRRIDGSGAGPGRLLRHGMRNTSSQLPHLRPIRRRHAAVLHGRRGVGVGRLLRTGCKSIIGTRCRNMMAPHIEAEARRRDAQQRKQDTQALLTKKLPPKRKLKAVKERIDQIIELKAAKFTENAQRAIDHIRQMTADDQAAIEWLERSLQSFEQKSQTELANREPSDHVLENTRLMLGAAYALVGRLDDAHGMIRDALRSDRTMDETVALFVKGADWPPEWIALLADHSVSSPGTGVSGYSRLLAPVMSSK